VLTRFAKVFDRRTLDSISTEELNDYVVALMKSGMSANTVLHNVVIIAQFCKRNGRPGLTRLLHLPERISPLPLEYTEEELASFFEVTTDRERELFSTFLLTGFREQEVAFLFWSDINLRLRTIRVTSKPHLGFSPKRWEEREIPIPVELARLLEKRPRLHSERFVFPSPTGNREHNMLLRSRSGGRECHRKRRRRRCAGCRKSRSRGPRRRRGARSCNWRRRRRYRWSATAYRKAAPGGRV
jgi:site-specific recombinase XerD